MGPFHQLRSTNVILKWHDWLKYCSEFTWHTKTAHSLQPATQLSCYYKNHKPKDSDNFYTSPKGYVRISEFYVPSSPELRRCSPRSQPNTLSLRIPFCLSFCLVGLDFIKLRRNPISLPCFLETVRGGRQRAAEYWHYSGKGRLLWWVRGPSLWGAWMFLHECHHRHRI